MHQKLIFVFVAACLALITASPRDINRHHRRHHHNKKSHSFDEAHDGSLGEPLPPRIVELLASNKRPSGDDDNGSKYKDDIERNHDENELTDKSPDFGPAEHRESIEKIDANCPKCKQNRMRVTQDEMTALRIEYVKNQILEKLGLSERPPFVEADELPEPIKEGYAIHTYDDHDHVKSQLDDFYAKTTEKIIFLTHELEKCETHEFEDIPSECFSLQMPSDIDVESVESAQLWIYQEPESPDYDKNHTMLLSEIGHWGSDPDVMMAKPIQIAEINNSKGAWVKIDIKKTVVEWADNDDTSRTIQIACETCSSRRLPIALHHEHKPFIVIDTSPQKTIRRKTRNINCGTGSKECCRDSVYVNFTSIGWSDWIVEPEGYQAYFCKGSCKRVASITAMDKASSKVLHAFKYDSPEPHPKKLEIIPCCTPTRYSSLEIFMRERDGSAVRKMMPNMIVESCGCS